MRYDVIIAGAGPAGSTCARLCAAAGISTLLLERETFPRAKPCGGAVAERALGLLGFPLPAGMIEREIFGVRIHFRGRSVEVRKDRRIAVLVDRRDFDQHLAGRAAQAGAGLRQGEALQEAAVRPDHVEVLTSRGRYEARCVVGADGANSIVGRMIRPLFGRDEIATALVGRAAGGGNDPGRQDGMLEMYFGAAPMGYGWVFPLRGAYGVGIMGRAIDFADPRRSFAVFAASAGLAPDGPLGHTIPWGGFARKLVGPRMLLAGDAAGLADPFHGEGIFSAVLSGKLAAQAVVDGIKGKKETLPWYAAECERLIMREMRVALMLARLRDRHPDLFLKLFFDDREALGRYLDIPAGQSDYRRFRAWLLTQVPRALLGMLLPGRQAGSSGSGK
jgi:geranylgeranyl reductase family protein